MNTGRSFKVTSIFLGVVLVLLNEINDSLQKLEPPLSKDNRFKVYVPPLIKKNRGNFETFHKIALAEYKIFSLFRRI